MLAGNPRDRLLGAGAGVDTFGAGMGIRIAHQALLGWLSVSNGGGQGGGVAWFAHLGGFATGAAWGLIARGQYGDGAELRRGRD